MLCVDLYRNVEGSGTEKTLQELLSTHVFSLNLNDQPGSPHQPITVRRWYIWNDAQRCFRKSYTNVNLPIKVKFVGEPGIDQGGPRREFFRLCLIDALNHASLFCGPLYSRFPLHNATAVLQKSFVYVGWLISMSLTQGGPGPSCFAPWIFNYLCKGITDSSVAINDIPSPEVQQLLLEVHTYKTHYSCMSHVLVCEHVHNNDTLVVPVMLDAWCLCSVKVNSLPYACMFH